MRTACAALLFLLVSLTEAGALDLMIHGANYAVRTDVGVGSFVNPDSFVLAYGCKNREAAEAAKRLLASYTVFEIRWRKSLEAIEGLELIGFTQPVGNSATPTWEQSISAGSYETLLLLFVDQDIQFDDPFGFLFLPPQPEKRETHWIEGVGGFKGQRVGTVTVSLR